MIVSMLALLLTASPLVDAVTAKDMAALRELLRNGVDVNAPAGDGATPLHWAVYGDDPAIVSLLVRAGAKVNVANDLGITPLYLASANGNAVIVRELLAAGARPDAASATGVTPLMEAARNSGVEVVQALLDRGAAVNVAEESRGQTALMWAAARQHPDVVRVLLDHRADVQARTHVRRLSVMLDRGPRRSVKTAMQDARQIEAGGSTALMFAALAGDAESARLLLVRGANANDSAADGTSPLIAAAFAGHPTVVQVLLDARADPNLTGVGYSALHAAVLRGDLASVRALLAKGADANARLTGGSPVRRFGSQWALPSTLRGATPLMVAAVYLEVDIIRALLAAGATPSLGLPNGTTPILAAAGAALETEARPSDLVRWNVVDADSPVIPRAEPDVLEATRLLLDAGANVNDASETGDTALHAAAATGLTTVIQLLADRGATLEVRNKSGQTPLALTIPRQREGRSPAAPGFKAAEDLLRKLGATQ